MKIYLKKVPFNDDGLMCCNCYFRARNCKTVDDKDKCRVDEKFIQITEKEYNKLKKSRIITKLLKTNHKILHRS